MYNIKYTNAQLVAQVVSQVGIELLKKKKWKE